MRDIYFACPNCNRRFKDEYLSTELTCPRCGTNLKIQWLTNGKQDCGIVGTTLVCVWGRKGSIVLPDNITKIGTSVFENSPQLTEVILSNTEIEEIGENAFYFCFRLQNIELPKSLKIIKKKAFSFTGIQQLFIPKSVELIEEEAFDSHSLIKEITVDKGNPYYYVQNKSLIDKRTGQIVATCSENDVYFKITLDTFNGEVKAKEFNITKFCEYDERRIVEVLKDVEQSEDKFVVCEADTPINDITFLQAVSNGNGLHIEFHLQKSSNDTSWENWSCNCSLEKCIDYFFSFIRGKFIPNFDEWILEIKEN